MGSMCSKPSTLSGGHTVLDSSPSYGTPTSPRYETAEERRQRMARAAEERIQRDKDRLINKNNPNAGRLASQVNKPVKPLLAQQKDSEPLRWD